MGILFVYGDASESLVFLRKETVETLTRLCSAARSAQTRDDVLRLAGDELTQIAMQMAEVDPQAARHKAFDRDSFYNTVAAPWTPICLMQIMLSELPSSAVDAGDIKWCEFRGAYLVIPHNEESRVVLALVSEGHTADRDDNSISRCAEVPLPSGALPGTNHSSPNTSSSA